MNLNLDLVNISIERISEIASDLRPGCTVSKSSASNQEWENIRMRFIKIKYPYKYREMITEVKVDQEQDAIALPKRKV